MYLSIEDCCHVEMVPNLWLFKEKLKIYIFKYNFPVLKYGQLIQTFKGLMWAIFCRLHLSCCRPTVAHGLPVLGLMLMVQLEGPKQVIAIQCD